MKWVRRHRLMFTLSFLWGQCSILAHFRTILQKKITANGSTHSGLTRWAGFATLEYSLVAQYFPAAIGPRSSATLLPAMPLPLGPSHTFLFSLWMPVGRFYFELPFSCLGALLVWQASTIQNRLVAPDSAFQELPVIKSQAGQIQTKSFEFGLRCQWWYFFLRFGQVTLFVAQRCPCCIIPHVCLRQQNYLCAAPSVLVGAYWYSYVSSRPSKSFQDFHPIFCISPCLKRLLSKGR